MKYQILSALVLLSLAGQISAQRRFIVNIVEHSTPNDTQSTFRCIGTIFTEKHILVPASCVTSQQAAIFSIQVPTGAESGVGNPLMENLPIERIYIHPEFEQHDRINNIAIIESVDEFNTTDYEPRRLGELRSNSSCILFGWGNVQSNPRGDAVIVHGAEFCDNNFLQVSCTVFDTRTDATCEALLGGPLVCGDDHSILSGFLISSQQSCIISGNRFVLNYHAVNEFRGWIDEISAADITSKMSTFLILSAILVSIRNMI